MNLHAIHLILHVPGRVVAKKFTPEHEYVIYDDSSKIGTMSITDYAQKALGDVVFVELPAVGSEFGKGGKPDL
jgi:glycine cleavage system H protein